MKKLLMAVALSSTTIFTAAAEPQQRWYQVEIIVFKHLNTTDRDRETWQPTTDAVVANYPNWRSAQALDAPLNPIIECVSEDSCIAIEADPIDPASPYVPFKSAAEESRQLKDIYAHIRWSKHYQPLAHYAWVQPGYARNEPRPIQVKLDQTPDIENRVETEQERDERINSTYLNDSDNTGSATTQPRLTSLDELRRRNPSLQTIQVKPYDTLIEGVRGTIDVTLGSYLHVNADLIYREQISALNSGNVDEFGNSESLSSVSYQDYRLQESRRVKLNDIHYLDHPAIGVVARIVRYEPEEPSMVDSSSAGAP